MNKLSQLNEQVGRYRWTICALVFFATTTNYLDRNVLGLLKDTLSAHGVFGPDKAGQELNYSAVVICFQITYAIGMILAGRLIDKIGTKRGYATSLIGWSIASIGHALATSTWSFGFWRGALGLSEAGNFPAANKAIAEWFPKKERAYATGLYNSGANVGAIVAPLFVPFVARAWGWEWAFVITGVIGLTWIAFWLKMYGSPTEKLKSGHLSQAEYDYIHSDRDEQAIAAAPAEPRLTWKQLIGVRQSWAFIFGKFITDPIWWFFLFWLPAYLSGENTSKVKTYLAAHPGYTGPHSAIPGVISWEIAVALVYTVSTVGSIFGGWLPKRFIHGGMTVNRARKLAMFIFAVLPLSVLLASRLGQISTWLAVAVISIACAAHQAWSANIFATASDMFPKRAVASVTGLGGMSGAVGGILIAWLAGELLAHFTALGHIDVGYGILFVICGSAYVVAWVIMHLFAPRFEPVKL